MIMDIADFEITKPRTRDFVGKLKNVIRAVSRKDVSRAKCRKTPRRLSRRVLSRRQQLELSFFSQAGIQLIPVFHKGNY